MSKIQSAMIISLFIFIILFLYYLFLKIDIVIDRIDTANEMLVQLRTNGIIGERVK